MNKGDSSSKAKASPSRRFGTDKSATRLQLLDATLTLVVEEGYAAVSGRKVAAKAGLNASLVHYYFPTTDDLLLAAYKRGAEQSLARHREAVGSPDPLRAFWALSADPSRTALAIEFMALANHRKSIRDEIARYAQEIRTVQIAAIEHALSGVQIGLEDCTPAAMTMVLAAMGRLLVMEEGVGISAGHDEVRMFVERLLSAARQRSGDDPPHPSR